MYRMNPLRSMADYEGDLLQNDLRKQGVQQNAQALQMGQQKADEYTRSIQDANALRNVVKGFGADPNQNVMSLYGAGRLTEAQAYQKAIDESRKTGAGVAKDQAETLKTQLSNGLQKFEIVGQVMSGVRDQASYDLARQQLAQAFGPEMAQNMPPTYDPNVIEQNRAKAMSVKEQMEQRLKQIDFEQRQANDMLVPDPRNPGKFIPNQPLINAKTQVAAAGASAINNYGSPVAGVDAQGKPVFFQPTKTGGAPAIVPGVRPPPKDPASGQPTEDERKAAGYAIRMEGALKKLEEVGKTNPEALKPGVGTSLINMAPEGVANYMRPEARQRVETAQVDALDAALTLATGAAYTKEQLKGLSRSYFTQPGDDPATIKDKEQRLAEVIETARIRAGRAAPDITKMADQRKPTSGAPVSITSDAEYNALKPGTRFVTPDGKTGTKR